MVIVIAFATFGATLLGGLFAMRAKDRLHLFLGFSAGAVIGVAFFDLIPEAIELAKGSLSVSFMMTVAALGFFGFMLIDRQVILHRHVHEEDEQGGNMPRGAIGAATLAAHSFLDGLVVGVALQVSTAVGLTVAVAILAHGFSDGINTVNFILKNGGRKKAYSWLLLDAIAPVAGIFSASFLSLSDAALSVLVSLFAGFFLYLGASDLLPESHHDHPTFWTSFSTVLGAAFLYLVIMLAGA